MAIGSNSDSNINAVSGKETMPTDSERIAILETKTEAIETTVNRVDSNVDAIAQSLDKQRGFIAGVLFVISPVIAVGTVFIKQVWHTISS